MPSRLPAFAVLAFVSLVLTACGSSSSSGTTAATASTASTAVSTALASPATASSTTTAAVASSPASTAATSSSTTTSSSASTSSTSGTTTSSSASTSSASSAPASTTTATTTTSSTSVSTSSAGTGPAALLVAKLGKPGQLLIGLGTQGDVADPVGAITSQSIHVDIYDRYIGGTWLTWNQNPDYVTVVADTAASLGAIPMITLYQMADDGEDNMSALQDATFMTSYWSRVIVMFKDLGAFGKPALVNLEPDFWGFTEKAATNGDPTTVPALVGSSSVANPDCASQPNNVRGIAQCLLVLARKYAPKTAVGFPPSTWGSTNETAVVAWMNALGTQQADFIVEQTLDRDAGCFEVTPQPSWCTRTSSTPWYWDESNLTHPNFQDALDRAQQDHAGIGNLPLLWWQTPEGVPSSTPGGTSHAYRDNRVHYFLTHPTQLTAVGSFGVVFGTGENHQTNITTDGGQMARLDAAYQAAPAMLP